MPTAKGAGVPTVAEQLIETLYSAGVRRIYGLVGDSLNPITEAVRTHDGMEWVHCHNEESAAFAAAAEAQLTGNLAVSAGSCGPGTATWSRGSTTLTAPELRCWPSPPTSLRSRSAPPTSRKPIPSACSPSAATGAI